MFDPVWPKDVGKAKCVKLFLTRLIIGMGTLWLILAIGLSVDLVLNGLPGSPNQRIPADFSGSSEQAYFRGSSSMDFHMVLFVLVALAVDIAIALAALRSLNRSIAGKVSRFATDAKWRAGMRGFGLTLMLCFTAALMAFTIHLYRSPHFPLFQLLEPQGRFRVK